MWFEGEQRKIDRVAVKRKTCFSTWECLWVFWEKVDSEVAGGSTTEAMMFQSEAIGRPDIGG